MKINLTCFVLLLKTQLVKVQIFTYVACIVGGAPRARPGPHLKWNSLLFKTAPSPDLLPTHLAVPPLSPSPQRAL